MPGFLVSLFFGFIPMFFFAYLVYWTDRYEKEPKKLLVGVFLWGALVAAGGAFLINTLLGLGIYLFTNSDTATELATGSLIAPVIEEILKGLAVLVIFLFFRNEFDSILDGIVYAAIAALGFAATENTYYIYTYGYLENGWGGAVFLILVRVLLVGWQHPFYTSFIGIGLSLARLNRGILVKIIAPVTGLLVAIGTHSFHNTLASMLPGWSGTAMGTLFDWTGWFILFLFCLWALYREHSWLVKNLRSEVQDGIISIAQYKTACSAWAQSAARLGALFSGRYKATDRFYQVCAELAFKKEQVMTLGDESGNNALVEKLRLELAQLATKAET
jgi:RsiW-degrading membrane proteinase PrsW (M82 family)